MRRARLPWRGAAPAPGPTHPGPAPAPHSLQPTELPVNPPTASNCQPVVKRPRGRPRKAPKHLQHPAPPPKSPLTVLSKSSPTEAKSCITDAVSEFWHTRLTRSSTRRRTELLNTARNVAVEQPREDLACDALGGTVASSLTRRTLPSKPPKRSRVNTVALPQPTEGNLASSSRRKQFPSRPLSGSQVAPDDELACDNISDITVTSSDGFKKYPRQRPKKPQKNAKILQEAIVSVEKVSSDASVASSHSTGRRTGRWSSLAFEPRVTRAEKRRSEISKTPVMPKMPTKAPTLADDGCSCRPNGGWKRKSEPPAPTVKGLVELKVVAERLRVDPKALQKVRVLARRLENISGGTVAVTRSSRERGDRSPAVPDEGEATETEADAASGENSQAVANSPRSQLGEHRPTAVRSARVKATNRHKSTAKNITLRESASERKQTTRRLNNSNGPGSTEDIAVEEGILKRPMVTRWLSDAQLKESPVKTRVVVNGHVDRPQVTRRFTGPPKATDETDKQPLLVEDCRSPRMVANGLMEPSPVATSLSDTPTVKQEEANRPKIAESVPRREAVPDCNLRKLAVTDVFVGTPTAEQYFNQRLAMTEESGKVPMATHCFEKRPLFKGGSSESVSNQQVINVLTGSASAFVAGQEKRPEISVRVSCATPPSQYLTKGPVVSSGLIRRPLLLGKPVDSPTAKGLAHILGKSGVLLRVPAVAQGPSKGPGSAIAIALAPSGQTPVPNGFVTSALSLMLKDDSEDYSDNTSVTSDDSTDDSSLAETDAESVLSPAPPPEAEREVGVEDVADVAWFDRPCACSCIHLPANGLRSIRACDQVCQTDLNVRRSSAWACEQRQWRRPAACCCHCIHRLPVSWKGPDSSSNTEGKSFEHCSVQTDFPWPQSAASARRRLATRSNSRKLLAVRSEASSPAPAAAEPKTSPSPKHRASRAVTPTTNGLCPGKRASSTAASAEGASGAPEPSGSPLLRKSPAADSSCLLQGATWWDPSGSQEQGREPLTLEDYTQACNVSLRTCPRPPPGQRGGVWEWIRGVGWVVLV